MKEAKPKAEIHLVIVEAKVRKYFKKFRVVQTILFFLLINSFYFISLRK